MKVFVSASSPFPRPNSRPAFAITPGGAGIDLHLHAWNSALPDSSQSSGAASSMTQSSASLTRPRLPKPPKKSFIGRAITGHVNRASEKDLNRHTDPNSSLPPIRVKPLPKPVASIADGIRLAVVGGQHRRQIARVRQDLERLQRLPETRAAYANFFTEEKQLHLDLQRRFDPILEQLELPDNSALAASATRYLEKSREHFGANTGQATVDALFHALWAAYLGSNGEVRDDLADEELAHLGYDPRVLQTTPDHVHTFLPGSVELILQDPRFARSAAREALLQASTAFHEKHQELLVKLQPALDRLKQIDDDFKHQGVPRDEKEVKALNKRGRDAANVLKPFIEKFQARFREFLSDRNQAVLWLSQVALQASARKLLRTDEGELLQKVLAAFSPLDPEVQKLKKQFLEKAAELRRLAAAPPSTHQGKEDYQAYYQAKKSYEDALIDLLLAQEDELLPLAIQHLTTQASEIAPEVWREVDPARQAFYRETEALAQKTTELFAAIQKPVADFFRFYDERLNQQRADSFQLGFQYVEESLSLILPRIPDAVSRQSIVEEFCKITDEFKEAVKTYGHRGHWLLQGKINSLDFNRSIEEVLKVLFKAYQRLFEIGQRHDIRGTHPGKDDIAELRHLVPLFETYLYKPEAMREQGKRERYTNLIQYLKHAVAGIVRFESAKKHGYPHEAILRIVLDFSFKIGTEAQDQTFFTDPALADVFKILGFSVAADHNTHNDFVGNALSIVQALLGPHATAFSLPDIIAKRELSVHVIEKIFDYLLNIIGNSRIEVMSATNRASHMQAFGSLPDRRNHATAPLGFLFTMDVTNGFGPYALDPHPPVSGSLPGPGRLSLVSEAAAVLTGTPQMVTLFQNPGAIRNNPNQRGGPFLQREPNSAVGQSFPQAAFHQAPALMERLFWYLTGFHPELDPGAPQTDAHYEASQEPISVHLERQVARMFEGLENVYPTAQSLRESEARLQRETKENYEDESILLRVQTLDFVRRELKVLEHKIENRLLTQPPWDEAAVLKRYRRRLAARREELKVLSLKKNDEPWNIHEENLLKKLGAAFVARDNTVGVDAGVEEILHYFESRTLGLSLSQRFIRDQESLQQSVARWEEDRLDPNHSASEQASPFENPEIVAQKRAHDIGLRTLQSFRGFTAPLAERLLPEAKRAELRETLEEAIAKLRPMVRRDKKYPGLPKILAALEARLKMLQAIEEKIAQRRLFSRVEQNFVERAQSYLLHQRWRTPIYGRDPLLDQAELYFSLRRRHEDPKRHMYATQKDYYDAVRQWNERRRDPANREYRQLHPSQSAEVARLQREYFTALETWVNLSGHLPKSREGRLFSDMTFRREGQTFVIEPLNWQPGDESSVVALWKFFFQEIRPHVKISFENLETAHDLHRSLGYAAQRCSQTRLVLENTEQARDIALLQGLFLGTHASALELMVHRFVLSDYGFDIKFLYGSKFDDSRGLTTLFDGSPSDRGHIPIDLKDPREFPKTLEAASNAILGKPYTIKVRGQEVERHHTPSSIFVFHAGTRAEVTYTKQNFSGFRGLRQRMLRRFGVDLPELRQEGPWPRNKKGGPGQILHKTGSQNPKAFVFPVAARGGGEILPKQVWDAFVFGGLNLGRNYRLIFGEPRAFDQAVPGNPKPNRIKLDAAIAADFEGQFSQLTGLAIVKEPAEEKQS